MAEQQKAGQHYITVFDRLGKVVFGGFGVRVAVEPAGACDCTHEPDHHDRLTGACLYTSPVHGPCPCAATPPSTRAALTSAHLALKRVLESQGLRLR
jgi:hypothetical protein